MTGTNNTVALNNGGAGTNDRAIVLGGDGATFDVAATDGLTVSGVISENSGASAPAIGSSITKTGNGTLTLSGTNTYTGSTTVVGGTLQVNGTNSGTGGAMVNNTGTLAGSGKVTGAVTVNSGGKISPGVVLGTLTVGGLTLAGTSAFVVDVNTVNSTTGTADKLIVANGTATTALGTQASLQLSVTGSVLNGSFTGSYVILDDTGIGALTGNFAGLVPTSGIATFSGGGLAYTLNYGYDFEGNHTTGGNDILLTFTSVPEPTSFAAVSLVGAGLLARRKRQRC